MSVTTDLKYLMDQDPSLNAYIDEGIKYEALPIGWLKNDASLNKTYCYYTQNVIESTRFSGGNTLEKYKLQINPVTYDTNLLQIISDRFKAYLNRKSYGGILDVWFVNDQHINDFEKNIYTNKMLFNLFYET